MKNPNFFQVKKLVKLSELLYHCPNQNLEYYIDKVDISRRTFFRYVQELRDTGADITYCRSTDSYAMKYLFDLAKFISESVV